MKLTRNWWLAFLLWAILAVPAWAQTPAAGEKALAGAGAAVQKEGNAGGKEESQEAGKPEGSQEAREDECPSTFGPIITDTAIPIDKGRFAIQPTFGLSFATHSFTQSWRRVSTGGNFQTFSMEYKFTYGLWNNLEVFMVLPYIHNWASDVDSPGPNRERHADFGGLGDINVTLKYRLVEEGPRQPTVTGLFATNFPTGHFKGLNPGHLGIDAIGGGAYVFTAGLNLSKYIRPFIFYGNVWYSMQTAFSDDEGRKYPRDFVTVNLAAEYPLSKKWVALLEVTSFWEGGRLFGHKANVAPAALLSILPGIEFMATEKFSLALGVNIDLFGKNTDATVTPVLSMVYAF